MKEKCNGATSEPKNLKGVRTTVIRKKSPEAQILRRLREYLVYMKLRSLIQRNQYERGVPADSPMKRATEYEPGPHEMPVRDSDEEEADAQPGTSAIAGAANERVMDIKKGEEENDDDFFGYDMTENETEQPKPFVPSIKIKRLEKTLLISTLVFKEVALTSALFKLLEEEQLDIVYENQYRSETKVSHTMQVKVPPEFDIDGLERKLYTWAGKSVSNFPYQWILVKSMAKEKGKSHI